MSPPAKRTVTSRQQSLRFLKSIAATPNHWMIRLFRNVIGKLLKDPHIAELLRFFFLGTVAETTRQVVKKVLDFAKHFFVVKATFVHGDFAFDWVKRYLEDKKVWENSRVFQVSARRFGSGVAEKDKELSDGIPCPAYQPAPLAPEVFRWRNHWITVNMVMGQKKDSDNVSFLTLSMWSRNRKVLDEFVQEARTHYFESPLPPRELTKLPDSSGALLTARFAQGDASYDWMVAFMRAQEGYEDITDLQVTTKQADLPFATGDEDRPLAVFKPAPRARQLLRWRNHWLQFDVEPTVEQVNMNNHIIHDRSSGGSITVTLHNSKRSILHDLVAAAREEYFKSTTSKVTINVASRFFSWDKAIMKNRRALNTLILPESMKENLLEDAREFLASEEWYRCAGVPHRRGYLLYGEPGTGKSSTVHALAGELGLEIYYVQLSSIEMDDQSLRKLVSDTPSRCILLLEDIDCAFVDREEGEDDEQEIGKFPWQNPYRSTGTSVTLSGLLNVLDSVTSEEGRITFATTNHIEKLDPALIRAGRMDVKIEYKLATRSQISKTFLRIFEHHYMPSSDVPRTSILAIKDEGVGDSSCSSHESLPPPTDEEIQSLAESFGERIPEATFALAQIQGYLLTKKTDARKAVAEVDAWVKKELEEKKRLRDLKEEKKQKKKERMGRGKGLTSAKEKEVKEGENDEKDGERNDAEAKPVGAELVPQGA